MILSKLALSFNKSLEIDILWLSVATAVKKGASRIYEALKIKCQPVAINSGLVWPKKGLLNAGKTITISILKPIETNLESKNFLEVLESSIYNELNRLS